MTAEEANAKITSIQQQVTLAEGAVAPLVEAHSALGHTKECDVLRRVLGQLQSAYVWAVELEQEFIWKARERRVR